MWLAADAGALAAAAYLGLGVTVGAFGLYNMAMARMPAGRAAMAINLVPPAALAAGVILRGDVLTGRQMLACALIAAGVVLGRAGRAGNAPAGDSPDPARTESA
jgi:drug/metabolite transporter (DMT)-like permease